MRILPASTPLVVAPRSPLASLLASLLLLAACGDDSAATAAGSGSGGNGAGSGGGNAGSGGDATSGNPTTNTGPGSGGAGPSTGTDSTSSGEGAGPPCAAGTILCEGTTKRVCDGNGGFTDEEVCDPGVCIPGAGCTECAPGAGTCSGNTSTVCNDDGMGFTVYECDPDQGVVCDAGTGHCIGACSPELIGSSYIGCDYYPTVTAQYEGLGLQFNFAVAVANTSDQATNVLITRGGVTVSNTALPADSVQVINLPWINELKLATASQLLADGAYRLRTTQPVTVYQYSPLEYQSGGGFSFTNDASILLPKNAWTGNYRVASRNSWTFAGGTPYPAFYSVVAGSDGTNVTLSPSATGASIVAGGGLPANGAGTVVMNEGDVLQIISTVTLGVSPDPVDPTGSLVAADKPVQVIAGHRCTNVPWDIAACDHLEESMWPIETLSTEYIVTPPLIPTGGNIPKAQMVRVIGIEANTLIEYDPPQAGAPTTIANPGEFFEIPQTAADFLIRSDKPVLVSQYMQGQQAGGGSGDPAMALAVAVEQYRSEYLFHAPTNYEANYVNVTAPAAAVVTLDGVAVGGFTPIGATGYGIARVPLNNGGDGNHLIVSDEPVGISVYGYGQYTSYWYPGGLDLDKVSTQ